MTGENDGLDVQDPERSWPELPAVSVVIPTHNRRRQLAQCLRALERQTLPKDWFEVIVVDDGVTLPMDTGAGGMKGGLRIRVIRQAHAGPAAARNRGAEVARASILAFTDDDCLPEPDWLEKGLERLTQEEGWMGLEGAVEPVFLEESHHVLGDITANLSSGGYATANMFYRREAWSAAGGFDPDFKFPYREDTEFGRRVRELGPIGLDLTVVVKHGVSPFVPWGRALRARYILNDLHFLRKDPGYFESRGIRGPTDLFVSALLTVFRREHERERLRGSPRHWLPFLVSVLLEKVSLVLLVMLPKAVFLPESMREREGKRPVAKGSGSPGTD